MSRSRVVALALILAAAVVCGQAAGGLAAPPPPDGEAAPSVADPAPDGAGVLTDRAYRMRLRELEERVVGLKEAVFKAKTRLMLLQEEILQNVIAEARAVIVHQNDMGSTFTLQRVAYYLDTTPIYVQDNHGGQLDRNLQFEILNGNVVPGNHLLTVEMEYQGNGTLFTYLDGYHFTLRANYNFFAAKGRVIQITCIAYQRGDITMDLKERPSIKFRTQQFQYTKSFGLPGEPADVPAGTEAP